MKKAWIENNQVRDICLGSPEEYYHPDIAILYNTDVPDETITGAVLQNGVWVNPILVDPVVEAPPILVPPDITVSPVEYKLLFTSLERIAIKSSADPIVNDFFEIINDPRLTKVNLSLQSTKDALSYLVGISILTEERRAQILTGVIQ